MKVAVLHSANYSPNESSFLYPLYKFKGFLKSCCGISLFVTSNPQQLDADIVIISSKYMSRLWLEKGCDYVCELIQYMRARVEKIIWYDISDSTGTTHFKVLPYVDRYLKNQIFVDKSNFLNTYYGSRIFCDFMHRHFSIKDSHPGEAHLNFIPDPILLDKVQCGWNSGLAYFGRYRSVQHYLFSKNKLSHYFFQNKWTAPESKKPINVSCRIGTAYTRNTISQSRQSIMSQLESMIQTGKVSHKQYYNELKQSVAAVCPFGLGEISLRDFEVSINGAAMIKQDMSHIETWPNLWIKNQTYLDFAWDLSDLKQKVQFAIDNPLRMREYAQAAQDIYKRVLDSKESAELFCQRFKKLIEV